MGYWNRKNRVKNLIGLILFPIVLLMLFRWFEKQQVYQPRRHLEATGAALNRDWEEVWLDTSDGVRINAWFFPAAEDSERSHQVILLSHGNAGNLSHRLQIIEILLATGANMLAYDYRGYGRSEGRPSEEGTYRDVEAAYQWLKDRGFSAENIIAHGNSLGGGVSSWLAVHHPVGGLILQSAFTSVPDVGAELFPWLPVKWLASIQYDTVNRLPGLSVPVLVIHGVSDHLIPFSHAEKNYAAANEPKLLWKLNIDHNDSLLDDRKNYLEGINKFLTRVDDNKPVSTEPSEP